MPEAVRQAELPLLLSDAQAAELLGIGRRTFRQYHAASKTPPAIKLGGLTRWSRAELERWIGYGCPPREKFLELARRAS